MSKLTQIQEELKVNKSQYNKFGKYYYRSCEDILDALKPLLTKYKCTLTVTDDLIVIGSNNPVTLEFKDDDDKKSIHNFGEQRFYIKATATLKDDDGKDVWVSSSCAREANSKKGMDECQVTGAASSYARKYSLSGLFLIDDNKDDDVTNDVKENTTEEQKQLVQENKQSTAPAKNNLGKHPAQIFMEDIKATGKPFSISEVSKRFGVNSITSLSAEQMNEVRKEYGI
jgi:hypothetical protein